MTKSGNSSYSDSNFKKFFKFVFQEFLNFKLKLQVWDFLDHRKIFEINSIQIISD